MSAVRNALAICAVIALAVSTLRRLPLRCFEFFTNEIGVSAFRIANEISVSLFDSRLRRQHSPRRVLRNCAAKYYADHDQHSDAEELRPEPVLLVELRNGDQNDCAEDWNEPKKQQLRAGVIAVFEDAKRQKEIEKNDREDDSEGHGHASLKECRHGPDPYPFNQPLASRTIISAPRT